jgi:hypothetical protein
MDQVTKDNAEKPEDGVIVYGMYMEACRWDFDKHMLADPNPKVSVCARARACVRVCVRAFVCVCE